MPPIVEASAICGTRSHNFQTFCSGSSFVHTCRVYQSHGSWPVKSHMFHRRFLSRSWMVPDSVENHFTGAVDASKRKDHAGLLWKTRMTQIRTIPKTETCWAHARAFECSSKMSGRALLTLWFQDDDALAIFFCVPVITIAYFSPKAEVYEGRSNGAFAVYGSDRETMESKMAPALQTQVWTDPSSLTKYRQTGAFRTRGDVRAGSIVDRQGPFRSNTKWRRVGNSVRWQRHVWIEAKVIFDRRSGWGGKARYLFCIFQSEGLNLD